ncbi:MAG: hypothetical protein JNK25_08725 [Phycisphaerae bacterium]|nr:hypothetical protein [Phycisphaerae bacterium]
MLEEPVRSLSLAGLPQHLHVPWGGSPRAAIEWAARLGYRSVQLDGTAAGVRARELDRSARRDLAAVLRRMQLECSGIDLWIPVSHFSDPSHVDRAVLATVQAVELAGELSLLGGCSPGIVSLTLPSEPAPGVRISLNAACERFGACIADHAWPPREHAGPIGAGLDAAAALMAGADPVVAVSKLPEPPFSARLSDAGAVGRCPLGAGRLDPLAYEASLVTKGYRRSVIVDLRGLADAEQGAAAGLRG